MPALAAVECVDNGSLLEAMRERVLPRAANNIRFFADFARERLEQPPRTLPGGERNRVRYDPCGVVAVSTPWNAPLMLATWRVGPALAAGNTVVLKPPEWAPLTCSMLGELAARGGAPGRRPQHRPRLRRRGRRALTGHPGVDRVAFTGSPIDRAHRLPRRRRAADAGLLRARRQVAVRGLRRQRPRCRRRTAAYQYDNAGQVCLAGTRLLVEQSVLEPFLERLRERVAAIVVGDPRREETTYGPLIHPVALERVTARVARAREEGARLLFGGESLGGLYWPPTLFADVPPRRRSCAPRSSARCSRCRASRTRRRRSPWPTTATTASRRPCSPAPQARSERVSAALVAGTVWVNCFYVRDLETPFGGARESGIGREGGRYSFDFYCDVKTVCERTSAFRERWKQPTARAG